jgi:inner membrane protein involved in colicin E2 resistance
MTARLSAIGFILLATSVAWFILGNTISYRTSASDESLRHSVASMWGKPQAQPAPTMLVALGNPIAPTSSDLNVNLRLEHRRKGLLWYATYFVDFQGDYDFRGNGAEAVQFRWDFPAKAAIYDTLVFTVDGVEVTPVLAADHALISASLAAGQAARLRIRYRSQGMDTWTYFFGAQISSLPNFHLRVNTNFRDVDFSDNALAPTSKLSTANGWQLDWTYQNLFAGRQIAVVMPQKAQPGPLAAEISYFAPVSLLFYFFAMVMWTSLRNIELHPMNYFFLACAFFAFHLLLAYLVDHVDIYAAFAISAAMSVFLAASYLRLVTGMRFALREAGAAQFVYLVLFSFAFFFRGFTGLAVTIGAILTLFAAMQLTGRIRWDERFKGAVSPPAS